MARSTTRQLCWGGAALVLGLASVTVSPPGGAAAATSDCQLPGERQIVGLPTPQDQRTPGAVDVRSLSPAAPSLLVLPPARAGGDPDTQEFGAAVAASDFDDDGCVDLLVGAPGANRVYLVNGKRADQRVADVTVLAEDVLPAVAGQERFGAALAVERVYANPGEPGYGQHRIWIGSPGAVVAGQKAAGAVVHLTIDAALQLSAPTVVSQNSPGVPSSAEVGDRFGEVLEPVGDVRLPSSDEQLPPTGFPSGVAVGVPHEDVGSAADAGVVMLVQAPGGRALATPRLITQDSPGVAGAVEAGDRFGSSIASFLSFGCATVTPGRSGRPVVAIGSPTEDVAGRRNAGMLSLYSGATRGCGPLVGGLAGDLAGTSVVHGPRGRAGVDDEYSDRLVWGVPGEDVGSVRDAGTVQATRSPDRFLVISALTASSGTTTGLRYGAVLGSYALNGP